MSENQKKNIYHTALILIAANIVFSCNKNNSFNPVGGNLPTNYIIISNAAFSPASVTVVNGSSITFVNRSGVAKGIYSYDSVVINKQNILDNTSYLFKKDTIGTIFFKMAGNPYAAASITFTP